MLRSSLVEFVKQQLKPKERSSMANKNDGKPWTKEDVSKLKKLAKANKPTKLIANLLGRTEAAVRNKASQEGISLSPTNKSPYNRRRK